MANNNPKFSERTITDFRTRLSGGGSRANLFECEINLPQFIKRELGDLARELDEDLRFMIKAAQIPGSTVGTIPVPFRGRVLKIAGDRTYDPWTITVINDTNFRIRDAFEKWSNIINRNDDTAGIITPSQYQTEMIVRQLGRGNIGNNIPERRDDIPVLRSYKFYGCWPSDIAPIDLSYDSTDTIEEYTITLQYQWWDPLNRNDKSAFGTPKQS
jgi:hypothetical protein